MIHIVSIRKLSDGHDAISKINELIDKSYFRYVGKLPPEQRKLAKQLVNTLSCIVPTFENEATRKRGFSSMIDAGLSSAPPASGKERSYSSK